jgi:AcrR family transcriptional regulator
MSPRRAAVLRAAEEGRSLPDHLIATAVRMIDRRGTANLTVRDIAHEAGVADGVLYNHFADKEDLVARALQVHVHSVLASGGPLPKAGEGTLEDNLCVHISRGLGILEQILPTFAGLLSEPKVIARFHQLVGAGTGEQALPAHLAEYLRAEQRIGRVSAAADIAAATWMLIGACHELVLPRILSGSAAAGLETPPDFAKRLVATVLRGIAP